MISEAPLLERPREDSEILGTVPAGSIVTAIGEQQGKFVKVELEVRSGDKVDGWMNENILEVETDGKGIVDKKKQPKGVFIPKDERDVLTRNPLFYYGVMGGGNFGLMLGDGDPDLYLGIGGLFGAFLGLYITPRVVIRLEGTYAVFNGTSPNSSRILSFGMAESGAVVSYLINKFELFGGFHYNWGLSLADVPSGSTINGPSDVGGFALQLGAGYGFPIGKMVNLSLRARYVLSLYSSPVQFQGFGGIVALEVQG